MSEVQSGGFTRRWIYEEQPGFAGRWWWVVALLLLLVVAAVLLAVLIVEPDVAQAVERRAHEAGIQEPQVTVDGQEATVSGKASLTNRTLVEDFVRGSNCDTLFGSAICPTRVTLNLSEVAEPRHHNFDLNLEEGLLTLIGEAPDAELKAAWIAKLPGKSVQDEIRVSDAPAFPAWPDAAEFSAQTVPSLLTGRIRWRNGVLSVDGTVADSDTLARLRRRFDALPPPLRGTFNVAQLEQIDACNAEFADVLKNSTITFETAKAKLVADAKPVLEAVATIANRCPGKLRIEGHTDATGDPEFNRSLSQARAEAVLDALIDLGLDGERVTAEGFGSSRPVAENSIAAGRAQNRRIEISLERVLTPGGNP